jgi:2-alkenal reductase
MNRRYAVILAAIAGVLLAYAAVNIRQTPWTGPAVRAVEQRGPLSDVEKSNIEIFEKVSPSVVQVVAVQSTADPISEENEGVASGTGVIWDADGHVITNNHVVQNANEVAIRFASGEMTRADIVGTAPNYDLAVLQIRSTAGLPPPVAIGRSSDLKVGQFAFAIGNPFGLDQSMSSGIISALKRRLPTSSGREIANVIQTDTAINPGQFRRPVARFRRPAYRRDDGDLVAIGLQCRDRLCHPGRHRQPRDPRPDPQRSRADARYWHRFGQ